MELGNAVALVTGGASGLGAATARRLVRAGAKVVVVDRDEDKGKSFAAELGAAARFVKADVTSESEIGAAFELARGLGPVRLAVSCAGVGWAARTLDKTGTPHKLDLFQTIIGINLIGTFNVMRMGAAAIAQSPPLANGERGLVVNTASVAAYEGQIGQVAYAASKAGVMGMTLPAARDLAAVGVRVMTIAPGIFDTPMLGMLPEEARAALAAGVVFPKRLGSPDEYAALVVSIAENAYLNGETIRLDGALRMQPK